MVTAFEPPIKNAPKQVHIISTAHHPHPIPRNNSRRHINLVVNNSFPQFQPSSVQVKSPQARFTDPHKQDFSLLAPISFKVIMS